MIEKNHSKLSIRRQCELLGVNRNRLKPRVEPITETDRDIMRALDELHLCWPFYGQRKLLVELRKLGWKIGRKRIRRLMKIIGIEAIAPKPPLSTPAPGHKIYPYLLRNRKVSKPNEVWCADITYVPMAKGHCYLVAIMDWQRSGDHFIHLNNLCRIAPPRNFPKLNLSDIDSIEDMLN